MEQDYSPIALACVIVTVIIIFWLILYSKPSGEKFGDTITKLMDNNPNVPTINLIEQEPTRNFFQKILGNVNSKKISFKIENNASDYTLKIPNFLDYNFNGKGLVIAACGNKYRYLTGLYANLYTIRKLHKSNIPIEIFYIGKKEKFNKTIKKMILALGNITIYDLLDRIDSISTEEELRGYQTKPLAVLCSSFKEVIILDADSLCFVDPNYLFETEGYSEYGMVLFKDYVDCLSFISKDFIETIGIGIDRYCNYTNDYEIDSSCVIVDKEKYWDALFAICIINVKSDSYHKSKNVLGDKDTWLIGSMFVGMNPYISIPAPKIMITDNNNVIVGHLQSTNFIDEDNSKTKEIFTHYNNQKIDLLTAVITNFTYTEIKNPRGGDKIDYGLPLNDNILKSFDSAKEAMKLIDRYIPSDLKEKVTFINGISKGLID